MRTKSQPLVLALLLAAASATTQGSTPPVQATKASQITVGDATVKLQGRAEFQVGGDTFLVNDGATYDPGKKLLEAAFVKSIAPLSGGTVSCNGNRVRVTYSNGTVVQADQMCLGGTQYTCSNGTLQTETDSPACEGNP